MLTALQWGLFGDQALPGGGRRYRMHPLDAPTEPGTRVDITMSDCHYEVESKGKHRRYRIIRSAVETVDGKDWNRADSNVHLFRINPTGAEQLDNPEAHIRPHIPDDLREVFFTDGDRALSFIEGEVGDQMKRVEGAIRSLLGLDVVEKCIGHVAGVSRNLNKKVKGVSGNQQELQDVTDQIDAIEESFRHWRLISKRRTTR